MSSIRVLSVNISEKKGTIKHPVNIIKFTKTGIENDAHSGNWHRQVSMLGIDSIKTFELEARRKVEYGEFAENITVEGMKIYKTNILDKFVNDNTILEITQLGKKCHGTGCAIYTEVGNCIMPKEGIFCRVIKGSQLTSGETLEYITKKFKIYIINNKKYHDNSLTLKNYISNHFDTLNRKSSIIISDKLNENEEYDILFNLSDSKLESKNSNDFVPIVKNTETLKIFETLQNRFKIKDIPVTLGNSLYGIENMSVKFSLPNNIDTIKKYAKDITPVLMSLIYISKGL